jgi:hypothetical protein
MRFLHIFSAISWLIAMAILTINWSFDQPITVMGRVCICYAIAHTTFSLGIKALESLDELTMIWDQPMDRRPRI